MTRYRKKPVPIKIEPVEEPRTITTLEGSQQIGPGQYLATGTKGEQWAFGPDVFDTYEPVPGRPDYYTKREDVTVEAVRLAYPVEIRRPGWKHEGKAGDWFVTRAPDDQYVVDADVFAETYEPVDGTEGQVSRAVGLPRGTVLVVPYRAEWKRLFEEEAARLRSLLGAAALAVEHTGSTAVEGLDAKPIIDLLVVVRDLEEARGWTARLEAEGYESRPDEENPDRLYLVKGGRSLRTHHLSLAEASSDFCRDHLLFRDYLREHAEAREEYRALKHRLAREFPHDRGAYTEGKGDFVKRILERARRPRGR